MKCPVCVGTGFFDIEPYAHREVRTVAEARTYSARILRDEGYSFRQIMKALGLKSPRSVELMVRDVSKLRKSEDDKNII